MARIVNPSPLELFVKAYLKKNDNLRSVKENDLLRKAVVYISEKLESTCCDSPNAIVDLHTPKDNELTRTVFAILETTPRKGHRKSLLRAKQLLLDAIMPPCCIKAKSVATITAGPTGTVELGSAGTGGTHVANVTATLTGPFADEVLKATIYINGVADTEDTSDPYLFTFNTVVPAGGAAAAKSYFVRFTFKNGTTVDTATNTFTAQDLS